MILGSLFRSTSFGNLCVVSRAAARAGALVSRLSVCLFTFVYVSWADVVGLSVTE